MVIRTKTANEFIIRHFSGSVIYSAVSEAYTEEFFYYRMTNILYFIGRFHRKEFDENI